MPILNKVTNTISPNTIDDFKAQIAGRQGLAKSDRFMIFLVPPDFKVINTDVQGMISTGLSAIAAGKAPSASTLGATFLNDPRAISILCESCSIPGRILGAVEGPKGGFGQTVKFAMGYANDDVTMVFHLTNDFYVKKMFDKWHEFIIDGNTHQIRAFPNDYGSDIIIQHLNENNIPTYGVRLIKAYPANIQAIDLSNASSDQTIRLSVTFAYQDFVNEGSIKSLADGISSNILGTLSF